MSFDNQHKKSPQNRYRTYALNLMSKVPKLPDVACAVGDDNWTTICDGDTRCAAQNLKSRFSPLHSILRQKYRVERFSKGLPTSSLCILQVSEAECQGIKSYARFSASTAQRTNVDDIGDVIVKLDTCEADVAAEQVIVCS